MIFVTVGSQKIPFDRLIRQIDKMVQSGEIQEEVFAQIGASEYTPSSFLYQRYLSAGEYSQKIQECDLLITHSGVATIMEGKRHHKRVIVVPRLSRYGEHVDDHQIQIADSFSELGLVMKCSNIEELGTVICQCRETPVKDYHSHREEAVGLLREYLRERKEQKNERL